MSVTQEDVRCRGIKLSIVDETGGTVGRAFLYIMYNDLHDQPFGFVEDVFIFDHMRSRGFGTKLVQLVIEAAREAGCYKLIATSRYSRPRVHTLYASQGFHERGTEFRMDFS